MKTRKPKIKINVHTITIMVAHGQIRCPRTFAGYARAISYADQQRLCGWSIWAAETVALLESLQAEDGDKPETEIPARYQSPQFVISSTGVFQARRRK